MHKNAGEKAKNPVESLQWRRRPEIADFCPLSWSGLFLSFLHCNSKDVSLCVALWPRVSHVCCAIALRAPVLSLDHQVEHQAWIRPPSVGNTEECTMDSGPEEGVTAKGVFSLEESLRSRSRISLESLGNGRIILSFPQCFHRIVPGCSREFPPPPRPERLNNNFEPLPFPGLSLKGYVNQGAPNPPEFAQPGSSRSNGSHPQREGTNLGVFVPIWLVLPRCEATSLGVCVCVCVCVFLCGWYCPGVRPQVWVCLICVMSTYSSGAVQIRVCLKPAESIGLMRWQTLEI